MNISNLVRKTTLVIVFIGTSICAKSMGAPAVAGAPPAGAPPAGNGSPCWNPPCIPIDGGIAFLLAGAAVLGARTIMRQTKEE